MTLNRLHNCTNPYQGKYKKVLCVCSAGLLRSPTTALVLAGEPYNFNTRACGLDTHHALVPIDQVLLSWAEEIVVMNPHQIGEVTDKLELYKIAPKKIICLGIPDKYPYRDPEMIALIKKAYDDAQIMEREE